MTNEIIQYKAPAALTRFQPQTLDDIMRMATMFEASGMFPTDSGRTQTAAQLAVKILAGQELGLTPFAAANGMQIIKGRCTPSANIMAMKVKASGRYDYRVLEMTDAKVSVEFYESGKPAGVSTFTAADANKAGTQNMGKFPRNMLFARAISNGVKWYAPDLFNGVAVYTPDEMGADVDYETGEILSVPAGAGTAITVEQPADDLPTTLDDLDELAPADDDQAPPPAKVGQATQPQLNTLHALGNALYGNQATWDSKRPGIVSGATNKRTTHSGDLWQAEAASLIAMLEKRVRNEYTETAQMMGEQFADAIELGGVELARAMTALRKRVEQAAQGEPVTA